MGDNICNPEKGLICIWKGLIFKIYTKFPQLKEVNKPNKKDIYLKKSYKLSTGIWKDTQSLIELDVH